MLEAEVIVEYIRSKYEHSYRFLQMASKDPQSGQVGGSLCDTKIESGRG